MAQKRPTLLRWVLLATTAQVAMVVIGHWVSAIANIFGILGTAISLVFGYLFVRASGRKGTKAIAGGATVGGVSALFGVAISFLMGDVTGQIFVIGTVSGLAAGGIGGFVAGLRAPKGEGEPAA